MYVDKMLFYFIGKLIDQLIIKYFINKVKKKSRKMENLLAKFCKKESKKEVTLEDLQAVLLRTQPPSKQIKVSSCDFNEVYPRIYIGDW